MSLSLLGRLRRYGIIVAIALAITTLFLFSLLVSTTPGAVPNLYAALSAMLALALVLGWAFFRLQVLLIDPLRTLVLKAKELSANKEYHEPLRISEAHEFPPEIHEVLACFNQLAREVHDRDVKLKSRQEELARLKETVSIAREAKTTFIANINHEVRTPLNAIIGFSGVISDQQFGPLPEQYAEFARDIKHSGEQLLSLLSDIIALSRAELGTLKLSMEQFNPLLVVEKCIQLKRAEANERNVTIDVAADGKLPPMIADRVRFMQIVQHLLSNAIKYNRMGGRVVITLTAEEANNGVYFYRIICADTGIGITKEKLGQIFEYFSPMDQGFRHHESGRGLGLPLVKKLVEIHNGSLHIDSSEEGTVITIRMISDPGTLD
jgi:signal transduction histidine kinase